MSMGLRWIYRDSCKRQASLSTKIALNRPRNKGPSICLSRLWPLGIHTINMAHNSTEICSRCFYQQMIMIFHQAIGMDDALETPMGFIQGVEKGIIVAVIMKNGLPIAATIHNMIKCVLVFNAEGSRHAKSVSERVL